MEKTAIIFRFLVLGSRLSILKKEYEYMKMFPAVV